MADNAKLGALLNQANQDPVIIKLKADLMKADKDYSASFEGLKPPDFTMLFGAALGNENAYNATAAKLANGMATEIRSKNPAASEEEIRATVVSIERQVEKERGGAKAGLAGDNMIVKFIDDHKGDIVVPPVDGQAKSPGKHR